jgi:hypothetical protein
MNGVCLAQGSEPPTLQTLPHAVPRDASTVLCVQAPANKYRPAPPYCIVTPLGCINLGTDLRPYYHGGGLLPASLDRKTEVLTPGVFAPKTKWALRPLTVEEVLVAKDFSKVLSDLLTAGPITNGLLRDLPPGKPLIGLALRWWCNGGGSFQLCHQDEPEKKMMNVDHPSGSSRDLHPKRMCTQALGGGK